MKFKLRRTSAYGDKPIENCKKVRVDSWHIRSVSEEEFNKRFSEREGLWRSKGEKHRVTSEGFIARVDSKETVYVVEINTLDDLIAFVKEHGTLVIDEPDLTGLPSLEIYDDYRE